MSASRTKTALVQADVRFLEVKLQEKLSLLLDLLRIISFLESLPLENDDEMTFSSPWC